MQTSLLKFFSKTPKQTPDKSGDGLACKQPLSEKSTPNRKVAASPATPKSATSKNLNERRFPPGSIVWAKLPGYPWWPSLVCNHPSLGKAYRSKEIHVQFFDSPVTRSWISENLVKDFAQKVVPGEATNDAWENGIKDAKKAEALSCEERLETLLVTHLASDEDNSEDEESEVSPGSKENKPEGTGEPQRKRRRIIVMDSDDSCDDETFVPNKEDVTANDDDDESEDNEESEPETPSEDESPVKASNKRKRGGAKDSKVAKPKICAPSTPSSKPLNSSLGSFSPSIFGANKSSIGSPSATVRDSTKLKLAMFGASPGPTGSGPNDEERKIFSHSGLEFLKPEKIKDKAGRPKSDPEYNSRTVHVPDSFLNQQTPAQRQWWEIKSNHYDVVLFFKMGKFYELFHMDADVGVAELNLIYMKGDVAHCGFPEKSYSKYASTLVEKGFKVARIEQTETPAMMEERVKKTARPTKFDKVVERVVCQMSTKGTKINNYLDSDNFEGETRYLLALSESTEADGQPCFGVAFVDTTIGVFHLGQFTDDKNLSRLRTLAAHFPPVEILHERGGLTGQTYTFLASSLPGARREALKRGSEFWDAAKTLKVLAEEDYFKDEEKKCVWPDSFTTFLDPSDTLGLTAARKGELAVRSLGALVWYLKQCFLDQELIGQKKFEAYKPVDSCQKEDQDATPDNVPVGKYMVLDGITIRNLELVTNSSGAGEGTLLARLDSCLTAMGKRILRHWIVAPLLQPKAIRERQKAIEDLMNFAELGELKVQLKKIPDLERLLSKIHTAGDAVRSKTHPDSRAIMFELAIYSKRKIMDLLTCLDGFKRARSIVSMLAGAAFESNILKNICRVEAEGGEFPNLEDDLVYFDNAFDHSLARKEGKMIPSKGVDADLDAADVELAELQKELADYLKSQKKHFGCEVKFFGTGKNRFQLEVPAEKEKLANDDYELSSGTKKLKRYVTQETKEFLERQLDLEAQKEKAEADIQRKMFAQFSSRANVWRKAFGCIALLDSLLSLASYSNSIENGCFPEVLSDGQKTIDVKEGRHPCFDIGSDTFIPNDTNLSKEKSLMILTGPNMGGKSTLMRQTGLLVVLAQMGCKVPAEEMKLAPVDRIFTRLGAQDNIIGGESTFFVELQETSTILHHSTQHSLVLVDELGRGTATYDGTAIAGAVVAALAKRGCRTMFATHYHNLLAGGEKPGTVHAHMACMVENEGHEDITQEAITFLYKLVPGPCPKSHGFNAAKLAGLPDAIIRRAFAKAKEFESKERRDRSD